MSIYFEIAKNHVSHVYGVHRPPNVDHLMEPSTMAPSLKIQPSIRKHQWNHSTIMYDPLFGACGYSFIYSYTMHMLKCEPTS